ncbi:MAG: HAMP domain-containing protein [Chitinivibrionales bacterium]|nr:HAMP domain-containing protein [Chitinivibrionales bacterium]
MKIPIATKLFLGFLIIILLNTVFFTLVYMRLDSLKDIAKILTIQKNIQSSIALILKHHINQEKNRVVYSTFGTDSSIILFNRYKESINYQFSSINNNLAELDNIVRNNPMAFKPDLLVLQSIVRDSLNNAKIYYNGSFEEYVQFKRNFNSVRQRAINQIMDSLNTTIKDNLTRGQAIVEKETQNWFQKIYALIDDVLKLTVLLVLILVISSIVFAVFFSRFISNNLRRLKESARVIAKGDFNFIPKGYPNDEIGELATAFFEMADDLKKTQAELDKKRRLAAIGEIVAAVNHEINNPLMIISGNAQFLEMTIDKGSLQDSRDRIRVIIDEAERISQVTKKLRDIKNPVVEDYTSTGEQMINLDKSSK